MKIVIFRTEARPFSVHVTTPKEQELTSKDDLWERTNRAICNSSQAICTAAATDVFLQSRTTLTFHRSHYYIRLRLIRAQHRHDYFHRVFALPTSRARHSITRQYLLHICLAPELITLHCGRVTNWLPCSYVTTTNRNAFLSAYDSRFVSLFNRQEHTENGGYIITGD
jgi:hypothetical protein